MIMTIIRLKRQEIIYHVRIYLASIFNLPSDILQFFINGTLHSAYMRHINTISETKMEPY